MTHLCTVGERFSAGRVTLPNSSRACLRGTASYKGNPTVIYRFFYDEHSFLFLSGTGYLVTVLSLKNLFADSVAQFYMIDYSTPGRAVWDGKLCYSREAVYSRDFIPVHWQCDSIIWPCLRAKPVRVRISKRIDEISSEVQEQKIYMREDLSTYFFFHLPHTPTKH